MADLAVHTTPIPGLFVVDLPVHGDARGWFKENWQRAKMTGLGLPDFGPVQQNMSFNAERGATRGLHAEPWDKLVSLGAGRILGAWVDLREGASFGTSFALEMGVDRAVFVPRGVANGYQALEDRTLYSYLVNDHWSPEARGSYTYLNLADETVGIKWPIPLAHATISTADAAHPRLGDVVPFRSRSTLIVGADGQLGRALCRVWPHADAVDRDVLDLTDPQAMQKWPWSRYGTVVNAAAYTAVDAAETEEGRRAAWAVNVGGVANLVAAARAHRLTLIHVSSDYVFDGTIQEHDENEPLSPLGVYGQTKAAGDVLVAALPLHYLVRTSWVVGEGKNFVRTMADLASRGIAPYVVDDQYGRLTFVEDIAAAIVHLVGTRAPYGIYNVTCDGPTLSWYDVACMVYELNGHDATAVHPTSTERYGKGKQLAPRPKYSALRLNKIKETGLKLPTVANGLLRYLGRQ